MAEAAAAAESSPAATPATNGRTAAAAATRTPREEILLDIQEWRRLRSQTSRRSIETVIDETIGHLNHQLQRMEHIAEHPLLETVDFHDRVPQPSHEIDYLPIQNFAWDQTSEHIKVYITLDDIKLVKRDDIAVTFKAESFDVTVNNPKGKSYRLNMRRVCHPILPEKCSYKVKQTGMSLTLVKKSTNWWDQLQHKESKVKPTEVQDNADPSASIMNLMKNLYEEGDEDMKRTIAKAWTQAQDKRMGADGTPSPLMDPMEDNDF